MDDTADLIFEATQEAHDFLEHVFAPEMGWCSKYYCVCDGPCGKRGRVSLLEAQTIFKAYTEEGGEECPPNLKWLHQIDEDIAIKSFLEWNEFRS